MQNEEIKFRIIKAGEEVEKEEQKEIPKEIPKEKPKKSVKIYFEDRKPKFNLLYLLPILLIVGGAVYFFIFFQKEDYLKIKISKREITKETKVEETPIINPFAKITTTTATITTSTITTTKEATSSITIATETTTKTEATITQIIATETKEEKISTPTETKISTPTKETLEPKSPKPEEIKEISAKEIQPQGEKTSYFGLNFPSISINLDSLTQDEFKNKWLELLKIQKSAGSIYKIEFNYNNSLVSGDFVKDYFLNPSFVEEKYIKNFKDSLTENYGILFYYTYTRKFPILIFEIKDDFAVTTFMRLWDKESILKDFANLYHGLPKGKLLRNYTITQNYNGIDYKIAFFDNDYKFIWTIYNNKLIISTTLSGFKGLINKIK
jgi:hypothetical protein